MTSFGQSKYESIRKQNLLPSKIDTSKEKIFVYIKRGARIYFRNSEILSVLNKMSETGNSELFQTLMDTLNSGSQKIEITDIRFSYDDQEGPKLISERKISNRALTVNEQFEPLGPDMILQGQFMIYSVKKQKVINKKLKAVGTKGAFGTKYLSFIFPDKTVFYWLRILD